MNRLLLEEMLRKMKLYLKDGKNIGDLKIGALYALGNQLEAIFYFIGHELGSKIDEKYDEHKKLSTLLKEVAENYNLGKFEVVEETEDHVTFDLYECSSCKDIEARDIQIPQGFCSFEAGVFAGIVEKITGKHCFAQELMCRLQGKRQACQFMIVIPQE